MPLDSQIHPQAVSSPGRWLLSGLLAVALPALASLTVAAEPGRWRIMAVGDSITEGGSSFSVYRPLLAEKLRAAGHAIEFVGSRGAPPLLHEGYGGKTIEQVAAIVPGRFAQTPADIVLLHGGHNHFVEEKPIPGIVAATERFIHALRAIQPRVIVLVAQVIPSGKLPKYSYLPELNQELARLVARLHTPAQPVVLVDQATGFDWTTDTQPDRVHPNAAGAEKMARRWLEALTPLLATRSVSAAPGPMRLVLQAPIEKWDEAIPLGNGLLGGLLWGRGHELRLSLDRGDLWDLRPHPIYARPDFNYATVVAHAQSGRAEALNQAFAQASEYPTKLPGARLVVTLDPKLQARTFRLDLQRALGSVDFGTVQAECLFSEASPAALLMVPDPAPRFDLIPNPAVKKIGYPLAAVTRADREVTLVQEAAEGFRYVIHVASRPAGAGTLLAIAVTTNRETDDPVALAREQVNQALERGYDAVRTEHEQRWAEFWARSSVSLPDPALQQHYQLVQYFYGAASRRGAPPIPLQGLWTADAGVLPPWRGDYHHDLNTQLTYWAYLASGRFEQGLSFLDFMWNLKPRHEQFAREFFGLNHGMVVPGVMALDGRAMGSWFPYTLSPTMGAWVAQAFYWHWRYEMDPRFLAERAYPYGAAIGDALAELLRPDSQSGLWKLPLSSSPEIHGNAPRAWLKPHSNFDHALLQWLFLANAEMATALGRGSDADRWRTFHARLGPLAFSETGVLLVAPGEPLTASHRHHSQLMAIHPLGLLHPENGTDDRRIIEATLADVDRLGTSAWTGYSFSWMAALRARAGRGDDALRFLTDYREHTTSRNGFHLNAVITDSKISNYRGRAFTLEGNFAAAQAVHEMLLQSWGGRLRVFPALPSTWRDASFRDLRAEGGFQVTADWSDGRVRRVLVRATVEQDLRLVDPFGHLPFESNRPFTRAAGEIRCRLGPGQRLELWASPGRRE